MNNIERQLLLKKIENAELISFDVFDTLLFRRVNEQENIWDIVGRKFGIHGFRKLRLHCMDEADERVGSSDRFLRADIDEIYDVLSEHKEYAVNWDDVKEYEIQVEKDCAAANSEIYEIYEFARKLGRHIIAVDDTYLSSEIIHEMLILNGYGDIDDVYCAADGSFSADTGAFFKTLSEREHVDPIHILYIGSDNMEAVNQPDGYGIDSFCYHADADSDWNKDIPAAGSEIDHGTYRIICNHKKGFWYNLGARVGGPLYMGLYNWLEGIVKKKNVYFLSENGYNLYSLFKELGYGNAKYLYVSQRALTLAAITEMDEEEIKLLPPYSSGQTVGEILDYLCIDWKQITSLHKAGFDSFDDVIETEEDCEKIRNLYLLDRGIFLKRCALERENAVKYFKETEFWDEECPECFDFGMQGIMQNLLERFCKAAGREKQTEFYYVGIGNSQESIHLVHGLKYYTFLFDFYRNNYLQADADASVGLYRLFFPASDEKLCIYTEGGPEFESVREVVPNQRLYEGIRDFVSCSKDFVYRYGIDLSGENSVGQLRRLIHLPTHEETAAITRVGLEADFVPEAENVEITLEDDASVKNYYRWIAYQNEITREKKALTYTPKFSIIIPVYNVKTEHLTACIESVLDQSYTNFELIMVDDCSTWDNVRKDLQTYENRENVTIIYRKKNGHISKATNDGMKAAVGDFISFMDCDDVMDPDALYLFAEKLNSDPKLDFIYSDEDKITENGAVRYQPFFKPDWSPDLLMSMMYTGHMAVYRKSVIDETGSFRSAYDGSQDYDFTLRFMEHSSNERVGHISRILYHWRARKESTAFSSSAKNYAILAAHDVKEDYLKRNKISGHLEYLSGYSQYRVVYDVIGKPLVSIIIPSRDNPDCLKKCIDSIEKYTAYRNFEIIVIDNGSSEDNKREIVHFLDKENYRYYYERFPFNFSKMCNIGARKAGGDFLLFLNDDVEIFQPDWLERLLGQAQQTHAGAVGAKLYYPESIIMQHDGVYISPGGPNHVFLRNADSGAYYFCLNKVDADWIAVTGALLLIRRSKFEEVHGFNEKLEVAYNDVDLCLKLLEKGYFNIIRNDVAAYHYESLSRGSDTQDENKILRILGEKALLNSLHGSLCRRDPFKNDNFTDVAADMPLKFRNDNLKKTEAAGWTDMGSACIDMINVTDSVYVVGWSHIDDLDHSRVKRKLVVQDMFGNLYSSDTWPVRRIDVAQQCNSDYLYDGFESILDLRQIRVDVMPYLFGILTIYGEKKYIQWGRWANPVRNSMSAVMLNNSKAIFDFTVNERKDEVSFWLDQFTHEDGYYFIRGWAFKNGNDRHNYLTSIVIYDNDSGNGLEFEIGAEERIDVAYNFPQMHYLYYTGFKCRIFEGYMDNGSEYTLYIKLQNVFDKYDYITIDTGKKLMKGNE